MNRNILKTININDKKTLDDNFCISRLFAVYLIMQKVYPWPVSLRAIYIID